MTRTIRVPDPVYKRLQQEANKKDVSIGTVVKDWMETLDREKPTPTLFQMLHEDHDE